MPTFLSAPRAYLRDARAAFVHAPLEVALGVVLAVTFSVAQRRQHDAMDDWARVLVFTLLTLAPLFGLSMLRALGRISARTRWMAAGGLLLAALAYVALVFSPRHAAEGFRVAALAAAGVLAVALVPTVGAEPGEAGRLRFWRFVAFTAARIVAVSLYGVALYAALAGALAAIRELFDIHRGERLFADLAAAVFFALVPWVVVGGIPDLAERTERGEDSATALVRRLGRWLYLPVLAIYLPILYAYTVRVLATGELPKNLLSPLILFAGLFGLLVALALEPLAHDAGERAVGWLLRAFPALLLPLVPLPIRAVWVRRDQYGWTELRYLRMAVLLALLGLAIAGTVRLVRRRPPLLAAIPATLCLVLLACAVGPWSATAVSRRDQLGRLRDGLAKAGLLAGGRLTDLPVTEAEQRRRTGTGREVPGATYDRIVSAVQYLADRHGPESLAGIIPQAPRFKSGYALVEALPISRGCNRGAAREVRARLPQDSSVAGVAGGTMTAFETVSGADTLSRPGVLAALAQDTVVWLWRVGPRAERLRVSVAPLAAKLAAVRTSCETNTYGPDAGAEFSSADTVLTSAEALRPVLDAAGRPVGQAVLTHVTVTDSARTAPRLTEANGWLVMRP